MSLLENVTEKISDLRWVFQKHLHEGPKNYYKCNHVRQW